MKSLAHLCWSLWLVVMLFLNGTVLAQQSPPDFLFSSGREGGNYHAVALRLRKLLPGQSVGVLTSAGSRENLSRLRDADSPEEQFERLGL